MILDVRHFRDNEFIQTMRKNEWIKIKNEEGNKVVCNGKIVPLVIKWENGEYVEIGKVR